jgi:hypothetical protein
MLCRDASYSSGTDLGPTRNERLVEGRLVTRARTPYPARAITPAGLPSEPPDCALQFVAFRSIPDRVMMGRSRGRVTPHGTPNPRSRFEVRSKFSYLGASPSPFSGFRSRGLAETGLRGRLL